MSIVKLPETSTYIATTHVIPDDEEDLHEYVHCQCKPEFDQTDKGVVVLHTTLRRKQ